VVVDPEVVDFPGALLVEEVSLVEDQSVAPKPISLLLPPGNQPTTFPKIAP